MKKRYVITSAVPGAKLNFKFFRSLEQYCKRNKNTELVIIPCPPLYKDDVLDSRIPKELIVTDEKVLNTNIHVSLLPIHPETSDPIAGLERYVQQEGCMILGSPKLRMKSVASPKSALPRVIMTTGAITKQYNKATRRGITAAKDHVNGAVIVEVDNANVFHFRHITANNTKGYFIDLGVKYYPNGKKVKEHIEVLTPGDYHCWFTDPKVRASLLSILKNYKVNNLILHDFFDGISVNPHVRNKRLERGLLGDMGDLTKELDFGAKELSILSAKARNTYIVDSNHDDFLDRWLEAAEYVDDARNHVIGLELALAKARGHAPLEYAFRKRFKYRGVRFLKTDDSLKLTKGRIEYAVHGHKGANGSQGTMNTLEKAYGSITYGHSHSPNVYRAAYNVGTSSLLKLPYNEGASSWMHTSEIAYRDGSRQLINFINGKWKI